MDYSRQHPFWAAISINWFCLALVQFSIAAHYLALVPYRLSAGECRRNSTECEPASVTVLPHVLAWPLTWSKSAAFPEGI